MEREKEVCQVQWVKLPRMDEANTQKNFKYRILPLKFVYYRRATSTIRLVLIKQL